jgi:hypothetical protein
MVGAARKKEQKEGGLKMLEEKSIQFSSETLCKDVKNYIHFTFVPNERTVYITTDTNDSDNQKMSFEDFQQLIRFYQQIKQEEKK